MREKSPVGDCALSVYERPAAPRALRAEGVFLSPGVPERVPLSVRGMTAHRDTGAREGRKQGT